MTTKKNPIPPKAERVVPGEKNFSSVQETFCHFFPESTTHDSRSIKGVERAIRAADRAFAEIASKRIGGATKPS